MRSMTKLRYLLLALPLAGGGLIYAATGPAAGGTPATEATPLRAGLTQAAPTLIAPGRIEPDRDPVKLAFEAQGRIVEIRVDEGDTVVAGQVLARLDDRMARARLAAAEAGLAQARARHDLARRGPRREDIHAAQADAEAATAAAAHRGAEQARSERLGALGAVATAVVDADDAAARVATAQASAATARATSLARGTRSEQVAEAAAAVALGQAEVAAAQVALDQMSLLAPHAGVIVRRTAEVGALVTLMAPAPVLTLADLDTLEIRAEIDEADLSSIAVGKAAYATADAFGTRQFPVEIVRLTRELGRKQTRDDDPRARVDTRVLEVIARFRTKPDLALPLGLRMTLHVAR